MDWIGRLWRGDVSLARAFWEYAVVYGTAANMLTTAGMFAAVAAGAPVWLALAIHLLATPYNIFMVFAVWRSADCYRGPEHWGVMARAGVIIWAVLATAA
jgi:hypothetical protein